MNPKVLATFIAFTFFVTLGVLNALVVRYIGSYTLVPGLAFILAILLSNIEVK